MKPNALDYPTTLCPFFQPVPSSSTLSRYVLLSAALVLRSSTSKALTCRNVVWGMTKVGLKHLKAHPPRLHLSRYMVPRMMKMGLTPSKATFPSSTLRVWMCTVAPHALERNAYLSLGLGKVHVHLCEDARQRGRRHRRRGVAGDATAHAPQLIDALVDRAAEAIVFLLHALVGFLHDHDNNTRSWAAALRVVVL